MYIYVSSKCMIKCPISLDIREKQIKSPMRYHYTRIRMEKSKEADNTKC